MFKKLNIKGVSHHFLLPVLAVLLIAGIGGYVMQRSSSAATKTVYATKNSAGKTCKQRTYMLNAKSACVSYAQQAMGIHVDGAFGPVTQRTLKSKTGSTTLNSASWSTLCRKIKSSKPVLYGKAGCNGNSYSYGNSSPKGTNPGYKLAIGQRNEFPNRTSLITTRYKDLSAAKLREYNATNKTVLATSNADDKRYDLSWEYLTTKMNESTLAKRCSGLDGVVKSKQLGPNSKFVVNKTRTAAHKICGNK